MRGAVRTGLGIALSAGLLVLLLRQVEVAEVREALSRVRWGLVVLVVALYFVGAWLRAVRWRLLFREPEAVSVGNLFAATLVGYMGNNLLPARLGEVARAYLVGRRGTLSLGYALGTVVVDRVLDVLTVVVLAGLALPFLPLSEGMRQTWALGVALGGAAFAGLLWVRSQGPEGPLLAPLARWAPAGVWGRVAQTARALAEGATSCDFPRQAPALVGWTVLLWGSYVLTAQVAFWSVGLALPWTAAVALVVYLGVGLSLPSAPGYVGTFQFFTVAALALYGVEVSEALTFSIILHISFFFPVTAVGWAILAAEHVRLRDVSALGGVAGPGSGGKAG
ncbi:MAG: flippase-like domain-containing protein [candidate division NC10 bacterium]|nr:flippase-like domain-containing protein [candidate division NC10 bacterium]